MILVCVRVWRKSCGGEVYANSAVQANCSVRDAGFGLRPASDLALPTFIHYESKTVLVSMH